MSGLSTWLNSPTIIRQRSRRNWKWTSTKEIKTAKWTGSNRNYLHNNKTSRIMVAMSAVGTGTNSEQIPRLLVRRRVARINRRLIIIPYVATITMACRVRRPRRLGRPAVQHRILVINNSSNSKTMMRSTISAASFTSAACATSIRFMRTMIKNASTIRVQAILESKRSRRNHTKPVSNVWRNSHRWKSNTTMCSARTATTKLRRRGCGKGIRRIFCSLKVVIKDRIRITGWRIPRRRKLGIIPSSAFAPNANKIITRTP